MPCCITDDGTKAVAKRKLQEPKLPSIKPQQERPMEGQAEMSGSNELEAASPLIVPKVVDDRQFCTCLCVSCALCSVPLAFTCKTDRGCVGIAHTTL